MVERCGEQLGLSLMIEDRPLRSLEDGCDAMRALLGRDRPPTAIFASSWLHTLGMLSVVNRLPDAERRRFGLIGTGAGEYLDAIAPWMTRVEIPAHEQGRIAIDLLFSLLDGATEQREQEIVLPMRLIERESTAPRAAFGIA
jgi:LacI family transcriptional regulator